MVKTVKVIEQRQTHVEIQSKTICQKRLEEY